MGWYFFAACGTSSHAHLRGALLFCFFRSPFYSFQEIQDTRNNILLLFLQFLICSLFVLLLQYCLWDHFKELDTMELNRSMNLARFVAEMLASFSLSLAILKSVDLANPVYLTPKRIMHFRMLFESIFENSDALVWNIFTRVSALPELEMLRSSLIFFMKQYVVAANTEKPLASKFKIAKKALDNVAGILM